MAGVRGVRLLGIAVVIMAGLYVGVGLWGLAHARWVGDLIEAAQEISVPEARGIDASRWGLAWKVGMIANLGLGSIGLVAGVGLMRCRSWGRKLWLSTVVALVVLHVLWGVGDGGQGRGWFELSFEAVGILGFAVFSWIFLTRPKVRGLFDDDVGDASPCDEYDGSAQGRSDVPESGS